jgi:hypothetical protein
MRSLNSPWQKVVTAFDRVCIPAGAAPVPVLRATFTTD